MDLFFFSICVFFWQRERKGKYWLVYEMIKENIEVQFYLGKAKGFNWFSIYIMMEKERRIFMSKKKKKGCRGRKVI